MSLYETVEDLRVKKGVSVAEMCRGAGIDRSNYYFLKSPGISNRKTLGGQVALKLAKYFEVSVETFLKVNDEKAD